MNYFKDYAMKLAELGYLPIPIAPGTKRPAAIDNWVKLSSTGENLRNWISEYPSHGVGISTENCVAVDIDVSNKKIAKKLTNWCLENIGAAPIRVGRQPRAMLIYRVDAPIYKRVSEAYNDGFETQRIEVLGYGQQFVAYAIHPDTRQPYVWQQQTQSTLAKITGTETIISELAKIPLDDLTTINHDQIDALFDYYTDLVAEYCGDWDLEYERNLARTVGVYNEDDDIFGFDVQPINISTRELVSALEYINADDRDTWRNVGFGIWHQYSGSDEGFEIWDQWSQSSEKYDSRVMKGQWRSFDHSFRKSEPITARTIMKLAAAAKAEEAEIIEKDQLDRLINAKTRSDVYAVIDELKGTPNVPESMLDAIARAHANVGAGKVSRSEVKKKLVLYAQPADLPECLEHWVFDARNNMFANTELGTTYTPEVFNRVMGRELDNRKVYQFGNEVLKNPDQIAVKFYAIPVVEGIIYAPTEAPIFTLLGKRVGNAFSSRTVPQAIEGISTRQKKAIERVKNHIAHLIADERDRRLFTSWLAYIVQNMGNPPTWAVLLQGVPGDGKTFFSHLMQAVLGAANCNTTTGHGLERDFNGWAVGYSFTCIEEVRVQGTERWKLLDKMKPIISNKTIEINQKGVKTYEALKTAAYLLTSNYNDALPVDEQDRRYMVLRSVWQQQSALQRFREQNPHYYTHLYNAVFDCGSALRHWLLNYELDPEFDAKGNAPMTQGKLHMIEESRSDEYVTLKNALDNDAHQMISKHLCSFGAVRDLLGLDDKHSRHTRKIVISLLLQMGFTKVWEGRIWGTEKVILYSADECDFGKIDSFYVRKFFDTRASKNTQFDDLNSAENDEL